MFARILAILALELAVMQRPYLGECPRNIKTMQDFDVQQFAGRWYEHSRYPNMLQVNDQCVYEDFELHPNREFSINVSSTNQLNNTEQKAFHAINTEHGKLLASFNPISDFFGFGDFRILGTDYTNYTVVYSCYELKLAHLKFVWILMREPVMSEEALLDAHKILTKNRLLLEPLMKIDQKNCDAVV